MLRVELLDYEISIHSIAVLATMCSDCFSNTNKARINLGGTDGKILLNKRLYKVVSSLL